MVVDYRPFKPRPKSNFEQEGAYPVFKPRSIARLNKPVPIAQPLGTTNGKVLNEQYHDPAQQLDLEKLIIRIVTLAQLMMEVKYYPYQVSLARRIIESVLLHDGEVITSLMSRQGGKCLAKGTQVLMFDGTKRAVETIRVGDLLMGDDSTPRTVLSLASGREQLWRVQPRCDYVEPYTVNDSHILSVKLRNRRSTELTTHDLSIAEYQALPESVKAEGVRGYKVAVEYEGKPVELDPYWLGLWLGDGSASDTRITVGDGEVAEYLSQLAEQLDMRLSLYKEKGACLGMALVTNKPSRSKPNPIFSALKKYDLVENKHIPLAYSANSRRIRLQLLAGLIDSDGGISKYGYEITQVNKQLALDIQALARSLGFRASLARSVKSCQTGACSVAWRCKIYGPVWEIPVRIARKQLRQQKLRENPLTYGFDLEDAGVGDYYGFVLDGNRRFILGDYTVTHNTQTVGGTCAALAVILPVLAKQFPNSWHLNITDDQGNYRGFMNGFHVGIYAPKLEQSEITFNRMKKAVETKNGKQILKECGLTVEENNGNTIAFSNGSRLLCQSASKQSEIEGATHHLLIAEEAQDIDDMKVRKSLHPMVASTMGTIIKIGTASTRKCDFYSAIQTNRRLELLNGRRNHFFFPWTVCAKYNSLYNKYIEGEKKRLGEQSDEFQMAYCGRWIFERGMFITQDMLFNANVAQTVGIWSDFHKANLNRSWSPLRHYSLVLGIDWGASSDSTVVTLLAVDWTNPLESGETADAEGSRRYVFYKKHVIGWWEFIGDNYEYQYGEIAARCVALGPQLAKITMDSNGCGMPMFNRFAATFGPRGVEVEAFDFQPKRKSDGYKSFASDLWGERITFPAGPVARQSLEFRKFVMQMLDLKKDWKNGIMQVSHPDERGAHDDYCFPAGSPVVTSTGNIAIENVQPGMLVLTSKGWRTVAAAFCSGHRQVIRRGNIVGTPNHPVYCVNRGMYVRLDELMLTDTVLACESFRPEKVSLLTALSSPVTQEQNVGTYANTSGLTPTGKSRLSRCTSIFTKSILGVFQKAGSFITRMVTHATTTAQTCALVPVQNTSLGTPANLGGCERHVKTLSWLKKPLSLLAGTPHQMGLLPPNVEQNNFGQVENSGCADAQNVRVSTTREIPESPLLVHRVAQDAAGDVGILKNYESMPNAVVPVYNLTVNEVNEYVCQGILVHNCDSVMMAAWGANTPAVGGRIHFSATNPFFA